VKVLLLLGLMQEFTDATLDRTLQQIIPSREERGYEEIPWRLSVWEGLLAAQKEEKPVLLYVMNGHPLGYV